MVFVIPHNAKHSAKAECFFLKKLLAILQKNCHTISMKDKENKPQAKRTWDFSKIQARRAYKNALRNWEMGSNTISWEKIQEMGEK